MASSGDEPPAVRYRQRQLLAAPRRGAKKVIDRQPREARCLRDGVQEKPAMLSSSRRKRAAATDERLRFFAAAAARTALT